MQAAEDGARLRVHGIGQRVVQIVVFPSITQYSGILDLQGKHIRNV